MTQTPPVSPDFAAMAREIAKLKRINEIQAAAINAWVPCSGHRGKTVKGQCLLCAVERIQNEAQRAHDGSTDMATRRRLTTIIGYADESLGRRALASDPVAGDQVAEDWVARKWETANEIAYLDVRPEVRAKAIFRALSSIPAPAPGLAAQEVERRVDSAARAIWESRFDGSILDIPYDVVKGNRGAVYSALVKEAKAAIAALSAPRPAQDKEGPTE